MEKNSGELGETRRERGDGARKSSSEELDLAKVVMFDTTSCLDFRHDEQLEFCQRGLAGPLDHPRMVRTPSGVYP